MSIDYSYSNEDAAEKMGLFTQYDHDTKHNDGWAKSTLDRMLSDYQHHTHGYGEKQTNDWKLSDYSQDEQDLWNWYENDVVPPDKWKALVEKFQKEPPSITAVKYDPNHPAFTTSKPGVGLDLPPTYKGGDNANGDVKVSTDAIRYVADQIKKVADEDGTGLLMTASERFTKMQDILPGKFARAEVMRQALVGDGKTGGGLVGDTQGLLKAVHGTMVSLRQDLLGLAALYEKGEEFNHLTAQQLATDMDKSWSGISGIDQFGGFGTGSDAGAGK